MNRILDLADRLEVRRRCDYCRKPVWMGPWHGICWNRAYDARKERERARLVAEELDKIQRARG